MERNQNDQLAITNVLEDHYFKGIFEGDTEKLEKIYHPNALLLGDLKGQPYAKTLQQYLEGVRNRVSVKDSGKAFEPTIVAIEVINSIATAKLQVKMYDFHYQEFLSFHKVNGDWLIVNKMLSDIA